jgi:hypothetical protein
MLRRHRGSGRHNELDKRQAVVGVRAVLDDPGADRAAAGSFSVLRPYNDDAHGSTFVL